MLEAKELVSAFLKTRGLELSEEKTLITHIDDGFDLLGWTFRKFGGKLIIKPSKKSIHNFVGTLSETILGRGKAWDQDVLIQNLNAQVRGWANYHRSVCASEAFHRIDNILYGLLWRWAKRRHPRKGHRWIAHRYWHRRGNDNWVFSTDKATLLSMSHVTIVRHRQIRMDANPYLEPQYFLNRKFESGMRRLSGRFKQIWNNQRGRCLRCGMPMDIGEEKRILFKTPNAQGGKDDVRNMAYVHGHCDFTP